MKAIICGAGIAGLTLAWWLRRDGWRVRLLERAPRPAPGGHLLDFAGAGYDIAEVMGLRPALRAAHTGVGEVRRSDSTGRRAVDIDYDLLSPSPGGRAFRLQRGALERVLRDALGSADIRYGCSVDAAVDTGDGVLVVDTHGDVAAADLLVGADGIHSRVREVVTRDRASGALVVASGFGPAGRLVPQPVRPP